MRKTTFSFPDDAYAKKSVCEYDTTEFLKREMWLLTQIENLKRAWGVN